MKLKKMIQFEVAGYSHHWTNINKIWDGDSDFDSPAQLVPEPTNKYDPNAIKIMVDGRHIGYVPAKKLKKVREVLQHEIIECTCVFTREENNTTDIHVNIWYR